MGGVYLRCPLRPRYANVSKRSSASSGTGLPGLRLMQRGGTHLRGSSQRPAGGSRLAGGAHQVKQVVPLTRQSTGDPRVTARTHGAPGCLKRNRAPWRSPSECSSWLFCVVLCCVVLCCGSPLLFRVVLSPPERWLWIRFSQSQVWILGRGVNVFGHEVHVLFVCIIADIVAFRLHSRE